jgi:transcriptional regulator with XRE-family HTH domain
MKKRNVTAKQLSEKLKIGKNQFKYWKDNGNIPNGETLISLADYFDCSVDYLLGRKETKKAAVLPVESSDTKKEQLIKNYELLNDEGQEDLLDYSEMLASNPRKIKESNNSVQMNA